MKGKEMLKGKTCAVFNLNTELLLATLSLFLYFPQKKSERIQFSK